MVSGRLTKIGSRIAAPVEEIQLSYKSKLLLTSFVLAIIALCALPVLSAGSGSVSGTITSEEPGNPAVAGATIRTEGEPGYSVVSGSNGAYTLVAPEGTHTLLISASGHVPQRFSISVVGGSALTRNAALRTAESGSALALPAPLEWGEPVVGAAPGDNYSVTFSDMSATHVPGAPKIAAWNDTVKPDESFTMTGTGFTTRTGPDEGTDTIVWVWARTSASSGVLRQARTWKITGDTIVATLPEDIPFGMYLIWVENSVGVSAPVCINRTTPKWIGPLGDRVVAGAKKRVFGNNISYNHGTAVSNVYIQPTAGGSLTQCVVSKVDPYSVEFTVPAGTPNGSYKVYVHSGHGGVYGWGDGLDITVGDAWVRGSNQVALSPSGGDDTTAIQNAIDQMSALPNGGSVVLGAGNFKTYDQIWVNSKVRLAGAGMNATTIELRENTTRNYYLRVHGSNINIENLTLRGCLDTPASPYYGIIGSANPDFPMAEATNIKYLNVRFTADFGTVLTGNSWGYSQIEADGCEFYRCANLARTDAWLHNSTLYGGPYGSYYPNYRFETESACLICDRTVYESCHIETKDWPINPIDGSRNYMDWNDMQDPDWDSTIGYKVWAKRVALTTRFGIKHTYSANLTTQDVAVEDNKGEMFLFHGGGGQWFGNVLSMDGLVMNLRTDGTVNGQSVIIGIVDEDNPGLAGGQPVPDANPFWVPLDSSSALIIAGTGLGQLRQVMSHTATSVTLDKPWRVAPDSTSVILISPTYEDNVIYNNELNAFPIGYEQVVRASIGVDFDGNSCANYVEGNVSHRTCAARNILSNAWGPSYWNVIRDDAAYDCYAAGYGIFHWTYHEQNMLGPVNLGNACRSSFVNIYGPTADYGGARGWGGPNIFENMSITAKMGYNLTGVERSNFWSDGLVLYRNGNITVIDGPSSPSAPEPVFISQTDGKQYLVGNKYAGAPQNYYLDTGLSTYSLPKALYRLAKFTGYAGQSVESVVVPIANAGIIPMSWTAVPSDPWITATIPSNSTLTADTDLGKLVVSVNTTGMTVGRHWGYVTISNGSQSEKIGVSVDIAAGAPANQRPHASFTTTPPAGAAALSCAFDAALSTDYDGVITSYRWDFGDKSFATGVCPSHTYLAQGTYTAVLTVTDDDGDSDTVWANIIVGPTLSSVSLTGNPAPPIDAGTPVALAASAVGGYQLQYKFQVKDASGWTTIRDYQSADTCTWTPSAAGYYEIRALARSTGSSRQYDMLSNTLSYPVGLLPTGIKLWLKADAGVTKSGELVSSWADQSGQGNNVTQTTGTLKPTWIDAAVNDKPVVRFTGPSQMLQAANQVLNGNTAFTAFTVAKTSRSTAPNYQYFWWNGASTSPGGYGCCLNNGGIIQSAWGGNNGAVTDTAPAVIGNLYRICSRFNGTDGTGPHYMWINGTAVTPKGKSGQNLTGGTFTLGNYGPSTGQGLYGDIAEILIYDRALSDTEKQSVESYLGTRWVAAAALQVDKLKDVKALGDGLLVSITSAKVATTASGTYSDGCIYVSESDRTAGLKVQNAGTVNLWDNLTITGTTGTDVATGERVLVASTVVTGANTPINRLGMNNKVFRATGQLVTIWGRVTAKTGTTLTIDDGSGSPLKVQMDGLLTPLGAIPSIGDYISVSGPAGYMAGNIPAVRVRSDTDIRVY
jgi:hypothetical protein